MFRFCTCQDCEKWVERREKDKASGFLTSPRTPGSQRKTLKLRS
jgi:hypothetical protein